MFKQIIGADGDAAYLFGGGRPGEVVVVDPSESLAEQVSAVVARLGVRIVARLDTILDAEKQAQPEGGTRQRFEQLTRELGITCTLGPDADSTPWESATRMGPVVPWAPSAGNQARALFQWGDSVRELVPGSPDVHTEKAGLRIEYGEIQLQVAGLRVRVFPSGSRPNAVGYLFGRRLVSGASLWCDVQVAPVPATGEALLELPSSLEVFPRWVSSRRSVPLAEEREAWQHHRSPARTVPPLDPRGFLPVVAGSRHPGSHAAPRVGAPMPGGFVDVAPSEALVHLPTFRVVMVASPHVHRHTVPSAQVMEHGELVRAAAEWDRDHPILVLSDAGDRCRSAARALVSGGMRNVFRLIGGMSLWEAGGLPTEAATPMRMEA